MQTFDLVVTHPQTVRPWRASRQRKLLIVASLAALAAGGAAWLARPPADVATTAPPKLEARMAFDQSRAQAEDEARIAAFQQAVALSIERQPPTAAPAGAPRSEAVAAKPARPRVRPAPTAAKPEIAAATPAPPPRPETPQVILADLPPPPPPVEPGYVDRSLGAIGDAARGAAHVPGQARDWAAAAVDRVGGALSDLRARVGL